MYSFSVACFPVDLGHTKFFHSTHSGIFSSIHRSSRRQFCDKRRGGPDKVAPININSLVLPVDSSSSQSQISIVIRPFRTTTIHGTKHAEVEQKHFHSPPNALSLPSLEQRHTQSYITKPSQQHTHTHPSICKS